MKQASCEVLAASEEIAGEPGVAPVSVRRRVAIGAALMVAMRVAFRGIGFVSTLILVRLLSPEDFGLVGFVTIAYSVLEQLSDLSSSVALIRMKSPERRHYDTAWTLGVFRGLLSGVLFAFAAPFLAEYIHDPRVQLLSYTVAALAVAQGCENVGIADLQRDLRFNRIFWCGVVSKLAGFSTCIPAAFILRSYWALVIGLIATRLASVVLSYLVSPYRPRFGLAAWRDLLTFSKWMVIINLQKLIDSYAMVFVVGRMGGPSAIGYYQVAYQIGALPPSEVAAPARQPMYAGYSRALGNTEQLRRQFLDGLSLILLLVMPASVGIALLAKNVTLISLGEQWLSVAPLIALCAFYALFDSVAHFCEPVFFALHRERSYVHTFTLVLAFRLPGILVGVYAYGLEGAVLSLVASALFNLLVWLRALSPLIGLSPGDVLGSVWRTMLGTCVMGAAVWYVADQWPLSYHLAAAILRFGCLCAAGGAVQFTVQYSLWLVSGRPSGAEATLLNIATRALKSGFLVIRRRRSAFA